MYWLYLSKQYMKKDKARTLYSICGIMLTFILCFSVMTAWYSAWDYRFLSAYEAMPFELYHYDDPQDGVTEAFIRQVKRLETYPNTEKLTVRDYRGRTVFPSRMERGGHYQLMLKLKDTSDLYRTAAELEQKTGIPFSVRTDVAQYLHQGESTDDALFDFLIMLIASVFGMFSAAILRNTMMIAATERVRDYGLFRCVGMSKGQLRVLLFVEGMLLSLIASVLGVGLGYLGLQCITPWLRSALQLRKIFSFRFYWKAAGYTTLLCVGVTLFSLIEPSRQAGLVSPISALHGNLGGKIALPFKRKKKVTIQNESRWLPKRSEAGSGMAEMRNGEKPGEAEQLQKKNGGKLWEKIFGVPGLYAYYNIRRSKGRSGSVFFAMFFSTVFLLTVLCFADSLEATILEESGVVEYEYPGQIETGEDGMLHAAGEREAGIVRDVEQLEGVGDAMIFMYYMESSRNDFGGILQDPYLHTLSESRRIDFVYHAAYEKEILEKLTPYLLEGTIDYDRMMEQRGVLLCDTDPEKAGERFSKNSVLGRLSGYKVGDTITVLSPEGRKRVKDAYLAAAREVAEHHRIYDTVGADGKPAPVPWEVEPDAPVVTQMLREGSDERRALFDTCLEEMLAAMQRQGYDCAPLMENMPVRMTKLLEPAMRIEYAKGSVTEFTIMGIVSADPIIGGYVQQYSDACMELIYPVDAADALAREVIRLECPEDPAADGLEFSMISYLCYRIGWRAAVCVKSAEGEDLPDDVLGRYAMAEKLQYTNLLGEEYRENLRILRVIRVSAMGLGFFIILVCMIQIVNTLQANMRLRRKELWLYDVVGMSPGQKFRMILIEHGLSAIGGMLLGMLISFGFSYWMLEGLLDVNEDMIFLWPAGKALLILLLTTALILGVNCAEIRRSAGG
ncbi:MAG: FtsX-like permease family protein [Lachnospiraceae bacterium]|nr:FtsX-like permease family protein [Lachnospiraceae bacterium]